MNILFHADHISIAEEMCSLSEMTVEENGNDTLHSPFDNLKAWLSIAYQDCRRFICALIIEYIFIISLQSVVYDDHDILVHEHVSYFVQ